MKKIDGSKLSSANWRPVAKAVSTQLHPKPLLASLSFLSQANSDTDSVGQNFILFQLTEIF